MKERQSTGNPANACQGGYGKCLDVKLTNKCDSCCTFCIERGGYAPRPAGAVAMAHAAIAEKDCDTVLVLGGEPLCEPDVLLAFLAAVRPHKSKIYMTTNGKHLTPEIAGLVGPYLDGVNVSVHHYDQDRNGAVLGNGGPDFGVLADAVSVLHGNGCFVRLNVNLVKGFVDCRDAMDRMMALAARVGADRVRFTELQDVDDGLFVDVVGILPELRHVDPWTDGCERHMELWPGLDVVVKLSCGLVNKRRGMPKHASCSHACRVLYPNGEVFDGWLKERPAPEQPAPARTRTARAPERSSGGCHALSSGCHAIIEPSYGVGYGCHALGCHS